MTVRAFGRLLLGGFALPKLAFRESNFLPEPKPKSLFEALRSKRFVRRMGIGLVLVMGSTFAALQADVPKQNAVQASSRPLGSAKPGLASSSPEL